MAAPAHTYEVRVSGQDAPAYTGPCVQTATHTYQRAVTVAPVGGTVILRRDGIPVRSYQRRERP